MVLRKIDMRQRDGASEPSGAPRLLKEIPPARVDEVSDPHAGQRTGAVRESEPDRGNWGRARASAREGQVLRGFARREVFETAPGERVYMERTGFRGVGLTGGEGNRPRPRNRQGRSLLTQHLAPAVRGGFAKGTTRRLRLRPRPLSECERSVISEHS